MSMATLIRRAIRFVPGICLIGVIGACVFESGTTKCADGVRCPPGLVCSELGTCGSAEKVAACHGMASDEDCKYEELFGICKQGLCEPQSCESSSDCTAAIRDDGNPCTDVVCINGLCERTDNNDALCDDGVFCNGQDHCVAGACVAAAQAPCAATTTCDEEARTCFGCQIDADCPSSTYSAWSDCHQGNDTCALSGLRSRIAVHWQCNVASNACDAQTVTETEPCPIDSDGRSCSDSSACTQSDTCTDGVCTGQAVDCDDGNECTADSCSAALGCRKDPLPFGTLCSVGNCDGSGTCVACPGAGEECPTGNPCTEGQGLCRTSNNWACEVIGPAPAGTDCRLAAGVCDSPEVCDGVSLGCPADMPVPDDTACGTNGEQCLAGVCTGP